MDLNNNINIVLTTITATVSSSFYVEHGVERFVTGSVQKTRRIMGQCSPVTHKAKHVEVWTTASSITRTMSCNKSN